MIVGASLIIIYERILERKASYMSLALILLGCSQKVKNHELLLLQNFYGLIWVLINVEEWQEFAINYLVIFSF